MIRRSPSFDSFTYPVFIATACPTAGTGVNLSLSSHAFHVPEQLPCTHSVLNQRFFFCLLAVQQFEIQAYISFAGVVANRAVYFFSPLFSGRCEFSSFALEYLWRDLRSRQPERRLRYVRDEDRYGRERCSRHVVPTRLSSSDSGRAGRTFIPVVKCSN